MCLHMFRLLNKVKWEKECRTLITFSFHLSCSFLYAFTVYRSLWISRSCCDTVCIKNASFCHCQRANRLIGLPCYPTQTVRPKEKTTAHFHNVIDRVLRCDAAWNIHTFACLLPQKTATLDMRQGEPIWSSAAHSTSSKYPPTYKPLHTRITLKLERKAFRETGSSVMKANDVL